MPLTIYHNPRCSKSRQTLALINEYGVTPDIVLYLTDTLSEAHIRILLSQLGYTSAREMMRTGEAIYKELGLKDVTDETALISAMASYAKLIERPIVSNGSRAVMGRPPENVLELLPSA
ncbi:arsenate reductase (glutaredoxin) [Fretibacter rubidus]|uniref:arsenate reductase (glutaredoxin) n=1 Tax=Fretibacter rubidus TaxID=570162 RepID=UPI00352B4399